MTTALVTGANKGIGLEIVKQLIAKGMTVYLAARDPEKGEKAAADVRARLSFKEPIAQRGIKATFAAKASGRTLTVTRKSGEAVVTWQAPDPIGKIVEVYASQYDDRVAVAYTTRRLGKEDSLPFFLVIGLPRRARNIGAHRYS